jgi:hypothetical protein
LLHNKCRDLYLSILREAVYATLEFNIKTQALPVYLGPQARLVHLVRLAAPLGPQVRKAPKEIKAYKARLALKVVPDPAVILALMAVFSSTIIQFPTQINFS